MRALQRGVVGGIISMQSTADVAVALESSPLFRFLLPFVSGLSATVNKLGLDPLRQYVHGPYVRAGYPGGLDDDEVVAAGILVSTIFTVLGAFLATALFGPAFAWIGLIGLPLGFVATVAHLQSLADERASPKSSVALPYALRSARADAPLRHLHAHRPGPRDRRLSGIGKAAGGGGGGHPLGVEFGQVLAEIDVGAPRAEAFKKMAERVKIPDISALVDAIVQSEELGWPLADTLERLADRMNSERVLRAQAAAGAAGVYVMLPSTLVLLSAVLLLFAPFIVMYIVTGSVV